MERKTAIPLNGLVYDYLENGKRIEFDYLVNVYQDGTWTFFHDNGNITTSPYNNGRFMEQPKVEYTW